MSATATAVKVAPIDNSSAQSNRPTLVPLTTLMIDADIVARFKATGPGWEERMADVLRDAEV
jgi:uncharacterized protein (DUF4415 family)